VKISSSIVGTVAGPRSHAIDARWLMAYSAALGETADEYSDTTRPGGVLSHPLFPVCYEWPLARLIRGKAIGRAISLRSVHATHDLRLHRRPRAGDRLRTTARIVAVAPRPPGAYVVARFETVDADDAPVTTTDYGSIYRGVACDGPAAESGTGASAPAGPPAAPPDWSETVAVGRGLAHVYTECARIWNPIHTDRAAALAAGLPDIILHGTATLALAVSAALRASGLGAAGAVGRIRCRFGGMVRLPSSIAVAGWRVPPAATGEWDLPFRALTPEGHAAVRDGHLTTRPSSAHTETCR
jgi:acyl dehydratase